MNPNLRRAQLLAGRAEALVRSAAKPLRNYGFPYRPPTVPKSVDVPKKRNRLGADYDTEWARTPVANAARSVITEGPLRLMVRGLAAPALKSCPQPSGERPPSG